MSSHMLRRDALNEPILARARLHDFKQRAAPASTLRTLVFDCLESDGLSLVGEHRLKREELWQVETKILGLCAFIESEAYRCPAETADLLKRVVKLGQGMKRPVYGRSVESCRDRWGEVFRKLIERPAEMF